MSRKKTISDSPASQAARLLGAHGGAECFKRHGKAYYQKIGKTGGEALRDKRGPEYFEEIGKLGAAKRWGKG